MRATGGNNAQRNLVVNTYGACCGEGDWSSHLQDPLKEMKLPEDEVPNHLIFEVHCYPDIEDLPSAKNTLRATINNLKNNLVKKGAPVIFGEWGTTTKNAYEQHRSNMVSFYRYFIEQTKASGMATFHWMGLSDGDHRTVPEFNQQDLVDAIVKGYYGEGGYINGIESLTSTSSRKSQEGIYDLSGRRIGNRNSMTGPLLPGIYIIDGQKVVVR